MPKLMLPVGSELVGKLARAEQEIIEATDNWLKREAAKDEEINVLHDTLKSQEALALEQQNKLVEHYTLEISEMKVLFRKRAGEFETIRDGMRTIEEFQTRKAQMEQELSDMKQSMQLAEKEHRENRNMMEYRFFKEKARLEKDAEEMIAQVEEQAHHEAVLQLDDASRCVFKENVRLNETLKHHMKEAGELHKMADSLAKENTSLAMDKKTLTILAKKNAAELVAQKEELTHLKEKLASLEQTLEHKRDEQERFEEKMLLSRQADKAEFEKLQSVLSMREKELKHIKRLASAVMEQRSELERFFHEALAQVKDEIAAARLQYKKEAQQAYRWTLKQATAGRIKFPPIRTFQNTPDSADSICSDMEKAARWYVIIPSLLRDDSSSGNFTSFFRIHQPGGKVEFSNLTWEQKEHVLRLLFAKMNRQRPRRANNPVVSSSDSHNAGEEACALSTFITQAPDSLGPTNTNCLEESHTT
ncbi:basal body-orientation factor 1-like isoform X2 [Hippocampus zosterae]|uniref:basal body-orientation factor 1-like isoform X2 n=1 Tax=Hippocampus zosterae TaxID=109293 RepID=UPI00223E0780|nr:basal body-orientation factor 1-like isoform X2 [Hippocampus zosterae]XP_051942587.1 basal body-orientation factor 1-like isoform X2 [Hippocampus zosterae]